MKFFIVGTIASAKRTRASKIITGEAFTLNNKALTGCIRRKIKNEMFVICPLTEVCRVYNLQEIDFLTERAVDILLELKQKLGYYPIIDIEDHEK
jgi:hypothetical protein